VTRSRFTAAALGAALLGLTAVLVPTASIAEPVPTTPAASLTVIWADGPDDFEPLELSTENGFRIANTWHWTALTAPGENTLADFAAFDDRGLTSTDVAPLAIVHGLPAPVQPADFPALMVGAAANVGADAQIGVMVSGSENGGTGPIATVGGFNGADTQWSNSEGGSVSTSVFAEQLAENESVVTGYFVMFMGSGPVEDDAPEIPEGPELLADPELQLFAELPADAGQGVALRAAAVPAELGVASIRLGDLTTYFTPQPTATLALARASFTDAQASTTGIPVTATGFAPGETVTVGLSRGFSGDEVPGVTFVADADGNVSGTVVLPAALAAVGDASLVLVGSSSGQFAASGLAITAGTAPVAVPVPGRATYTG
jgi:hypothetical protein